MVKLRKTADGEKKGVCGDARTNAYKHHVEQLATARENEEITQVSRFLWAICTSSPPGVRRKKKSRDALFLSLSLSIGKPKIAISCWQKQVGVFERCKNSVTTYGQTLFAPFMCVNLFLKKKKRLHT